MYLRSIVFCWVKNDWYGGLRQPTANFDSTPPFIQTQKAKPLWNSEITDLSLVFCRYRMEFCWPQRSKKYRCLCVCAKTAFAISTPVSFLYSFSFFHLVAWKRQGAAFYGTALCWASSIDSARLNIVVTSCYGIRGNKKATALCFKAQYSRMRACI